MKIGIDCRLWSETGVGRYIQNLVIELVRLDEQNEYVLFCLEKDVESIKYQVSSIKEKLNEERKDNNPDLKIGNWKLKIVNIRWHSFAEQLKFPSIINRENLDLMHFPYFSVPLLYRKPYVMTMHDTTISEVATGRASTLPSPIFKTKRLAYHMVIHQALQKAQKIIVPTKMVKVSLIDKLNLSADKIEVIYEGASLKFSSSHSQVRNTSQVSKTKNKEILQLRSENEKIIGKWKLGNGKYFLYVGNAYPHKNLERLIEAFHTFSVQPSESSVQLVLVGKEDYFYKRLKKELRDKLENVLFTGYVSDEILTHLYKDAKALVVPSLMEGFGLPAVEAMSLSVPLLVSDIPVLREVCGDAALFFDPLNVTSLRNTLDLISKMSESEIKKLQGKEKTQSEKFSWEKMAAQTLLIYESCNSLRQN